MSKVLNYLIEKALKKSSIKNKTFDEIVKKNHKKGKDISLVEKKVKDAIIQGTKIEMEHTDNKQVAKKIAMDHLYEDLEYYNKLKKIENKEATSASAAGSFAPPISTEKTNLEEVMKVDEYEKADEVLKILKNEDRDLYRQLLFLIMDAYAFSFEDLYGYIKRSDKVSDETLSKVKNMLDEFKEKEEQSKKKKKGKKTETKEATGSGSSGSYVTTAAWAKSTSKKDWRGRSKTQIPGGNFVTIKKKCKTFPYCNQGDIKALKIYENENVKKVIEDVSLKYNVSPDVIKSIIQNELETKRNKPNY